MSMFCSIHAFCVGSIRLKLPGTVNTLKHSSPAETPSSNDDHRTSSTGVKNPRTEMEIRPRFAPEFDGINCFETIVPY
ncbi:hypothetical protein R6Q59_017097 [Mikania micrantha]